MLRNIVGGEITEYTKMMGESREQAVDRMISEAENQGADGIVCIRFTTSSDASFGRTFGLWYCGALKTERRIIRDLNWGSNLM